MHVFKWVPGSSDFLIPDQPGIQAASRYAEVGPNWVKEGWIQSALEEVHGLVQATTTKLTITLDPIGYRVHGRRREQRMHAMPQGRLELDIWGAFCDSELARDRGFANEFWFPNVLLESW